MRSLPRWLSLAMAMVAALALLAPTPGVVAQTVDPIKTVQDTVTPPEEECQPDPNTGAHCHGRGPAAPEEWMLQQRLDEDGQLAPDAYESALEESAGVEPWPGMLSTQWSMGGPTNIGGRLTDVAVDPELPNVVYVSAATGGIWKSTDAGVTFSSVWPDTSSQSMGSLAIASDGTLFAGTGEANPGGGSITFAGTGVYRSRDRGATWERVGLENSSTNGRIMVDPTNPNRVFVAATGSLFNPGGDRGVYRTEDGGDTWERVLEPETEFTGAVDLAIDPVNPDRVFATMWDHRRQPHLRTYGGVGSGVFRTTDGGDTWTRLSNVTGSTDLERSSNLGRLKVAVAPTNPNRVYVFAITSTGPALGFYVSDDGGDTFVKRASNSTLTSSQSTFGWWFGRIWVDPNNADRVFAGGVSLLRSEDAGVSWTNTGSGTHADHHAMAWDLKVPNRVYLGNDGGFYRSTANGAGSWTKATYEPYTQIYIIDTSQQDAGRLTIGTQDNGCNRSWNSSGVVNPNGSGWGSFLSCGDGLYTVVDYSDHNFVYGCSQYGSCSRSTNAGNSSSGFGATTSQRRNWQTPVVLDPSNPQIVYYGGNILNRSTNRAAAFTAISPDLTGGPGADPNYPFGTMTTIAVAKTAPNTIWIGTDDGRVWKTTTGGGTTTESWTRIQDPLLPERWVTRIAIDPHDEQVVYATFSGFRNGEDAAHVFRTTDGGATWSNVSANLPNAPVNDLVIHPSGSPIYVATDVGVFVSKPGQTWYRIGEGPPLAPVMDLAYHVASNTMVAGTFGRSAWRLNLDREAQPPVTTATVTPEPRNGWHRDPTVTLSAADGDGGAGVERTEYRVDGGAWTTYEAPFQVTGDGDHVVEYRSIDRADNVEVAQALELRVDATGPTVDIVSPADGAVYDIGQSVTASYACQDATSGVESCDGTVANGASVDTSTGGTHTFTVTGTDLAGNATTRTATYRVRWPFQGFFHPVDNPPTVNVVNAGSTVPLKFSLGGDRGMGILEPGSPSSRAVECATSAPESVLEETDTAGQSGLRYGGGRYVYAWKTDKGWAGTCRQFVLTLADGSTHTANFRFAT